MTGMNTFLFSRVVLLEQMILGGSMVSEVFVIISLKLKVQGEGIFLAQHGLSHLTIPWRFYSLGEGISQHTT